MCNEIMWDILDEVRKERKIIMALKDDNIDEYINLDMTEIDIITAKDNEDIPHVIQLKCEEKLKFRQRLA